jgi:hypothetical protein
MEGCGGERLVPEKFMAVVHCEFLSCSIFK